MKKLITILALVLTLALCLPMFASCEFLDKLIPGEDQGNEENPSEGENPDEETPPADENKVTVSWYQGSKLLKEEEIDKGSKVTAWTPEAEEGKEFVGWFAEASATVAFDFETAINEDTDIFAKFLSNVFEADTNEYYLIGTGSGDMGKSSWDHANSQQHLMMTKEDNATANVYSIELLLRAGDMFQICFGGSWDGQKGIGLIPGAEYCDGVNFYDNAEYTAADKKVAQVLDAEGNVVFIGSDEYNKSYDLWNIKLADGQDGKYKITYTTYPAAPEKNTITYELVEKVEALTKTHEMYFIGTMNEWSETYENSDLALTESQDKSAWTGFITITEDMYADWTADENGNKYAALKIYNLVDDQYYGVTADNILLSAGTYAFKYTVDGNKVEYQELDYYVVGTFADAEGNAVNFAVKEGVTPKLENGTVTFTVVDVTAMGDFSWMVDQGKPGVAAIKVVYGCELGIKDWYSAEGGDNFYVYAGECTVTFADGTVTVAGASAPDAE